MTEQIVLSLLIGAIQATLVVLSYKTFRCADEARNILKKQEEIERAFQHQWMEFVSRQVKH